MLIHLVKKDFLIAKKYVMLVLFIVIGIPLFVSWRSPQFSQTLGFTLAVIFSEFMLCQNISLKENKYSKATALLCATPYPRSGLVQSKYILFVLVFIYCTFVYWAESLLFPHIGNFNITHILTVFLFTSLAYGIYLPIQYKLGYEKTKLFFMLIIMASPFVLPALTKYGNINILAIAKIPNKIFNIILGLTSLLILLISMCISIKIFKKKELV